ncbi:MAG: hypothetical protein ACLTDI_13650 [Acutalibacteraceae bacterium]
MYGQGQLYTGDPGGACAEEYQFQPGYALRGLPQGNPRRPDLYGTGGRSRRCAIRAREARGVYDVAFEGLIENVNRRYKETFSEAIKAEYETYMRITPCPVCKGQRLKKESLAVTVGRIRISIEAT